MNLPAAINAMRQDAQRLGFRQTARLLFDAAIACYREQREVEIRPHDSLTREARQRGGKHSVMVQQRGRRGRFAGKAVA